MREIFEPITVASFVCSQDFLFRSKFAEDKDEENRYERRNKSRHEGQFEELSKNRSAEVPLSAERTRHTNGTQSITRSARLNSIDRAAQTIPT